MSAALVCWKCGGSLATVLLPLRRIEECPSCHAELHVCKLCEWYEPRVAKSCREPIAEEVRNKEHANFCDYFKLRYGAYQAGDVSAAAAAKSKLDALFGSGPNAAVPRANEAAEKTDRAKTELERLFGPKR